MTYKMSDLLFFLFLKSNFTCDLKVTTACQHTMTKLAYFDVPYF